MNEVYITVSFETLEKFWIEMKQPNSWVQKLCENGDRYPDSNFGSWLFKNKTTINKVITDFVNFELRIKGNEPNKKAKHRIKAMAKRMTKNSEQKFNVLLYSQKLAES